MRTLALILAITMAGCTTPQQRIERAMRDYGPLCSTVAEPRTPDWSRCIMDLYQAERNRDTAAGMALTGAGAAILATQPKPAPAPVTCVQRGAFISCQ